jgi:HEAT repeat protein
MQLQGLKTAAIMVALLTTMLLFSTKSEAQAVKLDPQSIIKQEVDETVTLVRIGQSSNERYIAAMLLCDITYGDASKLVDDESLRSIIALLDNSDDAVRYWVALCLGNFGPRAKPAVPKLLSILDQTDCVKAALTAASAIRVALKKIGADVPPSKCEWRRKVQ